VILLARHGETDDNAEPARFQGWRDPPLNLRGRGQARALGRSLAGAGIRALYASHLRRALETAEAVGDLIGLEPMIDRRFAESRRGAWEGRLHEDIEREEPERWADWLRAGPSFRFPEGPGSPGESLAEHERRVALGLADVRRGPLPALVVCHGGTIRCALAPSHPRGLRAFHEIEVWNAEVMRLPAS